MCSPTLNGTCCDMHNAKLFIMHHIQHIVYDMSHINIKHGGQIGRAQVHGSWCRHPGLPVGKHYKFAMSMHCYKSILILI